SGLHAAVRHEMAFQHFRERLLVFEQLFFVGKLGKGIVGRREDGVRAMLANDRGQTCGLERVEEDTVAAVGAQHGEHRLLALDCVTDAFSSNRHLADDDRSDEQSYQEESNRAAHHAWSSFANKFPQAGNTIGMPWLYSQKIRDGLRGKTRRWYICRRDRNLGDG